MFGVLMMLLLHRAPASASGRCSSRWLIKPRRRRRSAGRSAACRGARRRAAETPLLRSGEA